VCHAGEQLQAWLQCVVHCVSGGGLYPQACPLTAAGLACSRLAVSSLFNLLCHSHLLADAVCTLTQRVTVPL